jgi:hypothetical protein
VNRYFVRGSNVNAHIMNTHLVRRLGGRTGAAVGTWLLAVVTAMGLLANYSNSPGSVGTPPDRWPADSRISPDVSRPTLVMFAHPRCPCTRASLCELEVLMSRCQGRVSARVLFLKATGTTDDWAETDLWRTASAIPGATVHCDEAGSEAARFHAQTSGYILLYDRGGRLLFQGGITMSRGHNGDNPGRSALEELLSEQMSNQVKTPVFGCSLFAAQSQKGWAGCKQ